MSYIIPWTRVNFFGKGSVVRPLADRSSDLASKLRIGCSGWSYDDWVGPFYPRGTEKSAYLRLYSQALDVVEVDSSFYHLPSPATAAAWRRSTPDGFLFTAKMPKEITHEKKLAGVQNALERVYGSLGELREKLAVLVVQLPPSVRYEKHFETLKVFVNALDENIRHAIEFRHDSWFRGEVYSVLRARGIATVWSQNQYLATPPAMTADFAYLRLVGERDIQRFDRIVKDRAKEMESWRRRLEGTASDIGLAFVILNNHYAGFSPGSVNQFREMAGLRPVAFPAAASAQRSLGEFG